MIGQGSAGMFWAWTLKRAGAARVIVADRAPARLAAAPRFGADVVVDVRTDDLAAAVLDHTAGEGADFVVEAVGRKETLLQSISLCRTGGSLYWFGLPDTNDPVPIDFRLFFRRKLSAFSTYGAQVEPGLASFRAAVEHIRRGEIDVRPLLTHVLPVEEIAHAFELADHAADGALKVSISF